MGLRMRTLVAAFVATLAVAGGVAIVASPAGATTADTLKFDTTISSFAAGATTSITVDLMNGSSIDTTNVPTGTLALSTSPNVGATGLSSPSFSNGQWTFSSVKVPTPGTYTFTATYTAGSSDTVTVSNPVSQSNVVVYGTATHLAFTQQPPSPIAGTFSVTVAVEDANNNVVANANTENITVASTNCTLNGAGSPTVASGKYTFSGLSFTQGAAPLSCSVTATDSSQSPNWVVTSNNVTVPGTFTKLAFTTQPPTAATYGVAMTPAIVVAQEDAAGNIEVGGVGVGDTITLTPSAGCAFSTSPVTAIVGSNGTATFTGVTFSGTLTTTCYITATDSRAGITPATSSAISLSGTTATKLGFTAPFPTTGTVGIALTSFTVSVEQANGVPTNSGTGNITLTSTCKLAGTTVVALNAGVATFTNVVFQSTGSCTLVATDSYPGIAAATSPAVLVSAGAPTHVAFTTAPPTTFGSLTSPLTAFKVSVEDVYGNVTATSLGSTDNIQITSTNCTLTGTTTVAAVSGVATFSAVTITSPGTCVLTATDLSRPLTTAQASVQVGQPQPTLVVSSTKGFFKTPLKLTTTGGAGTGAVTFTVVNGTAKNCAIVNGTLKTSSQGTCIVTATKAASGNYAQATSAATTVTIGAQLLRAYRVIGPVYMGHRMVIRVTGVGFYGAPRVISNTAGFTARVAHDTGTLLTIIISSSPRNRPGIHVLVIIEPNGRRAAVRFTLLP